MYLLKEIFKIYALFLGILLLARGVLYGIYFDRLADISLGESLLTFVFGVRMDTIALGIVLVLPTILLTLTPSKFSTYISQFIKLYFLVWLLIFVFIENATFPFFAQYDVRPNYLFIEYLEYPKEVADLMLKDYKLELIIAFLMMFIVAKWFWHTRIFDFKNAFQTRYNVRLLLLLPLLALLFIGIRSSFGHRPANNSDALYSTNRVINEITKNSIYSIADAYYRNKKSSNIVEKYGKIEIQEAYNLTSQILNIPVGDLKQPFNRTVKTNFASKKQKNIVIFIQESMGAQFVAFSGGEKNLTPNMNQLGKEYLAFSNLYSNGTRSIRGLAGLTSGFLPIAGEGVVKRTKSQHDFFTIASLLKPYGYKSSFIYGGEGRFDNMKSWYLGNGFDEVIEQKDFKNPTFTSTWGVCDEDLVIKAHERFKEYHQKGEKFATVMFSQSNHAPFELPENKIEFVPNEPKQSVRNAIKYADFAIGRFFELAKKEPYFKDTIFIVAADHNVRVYGDDIVPINMFQIPAVIVADGLRQHTYDNIATQPDVLATALDLVGIDFTYPILGQSIFSTTKTNIAFMQFNEIYALRQNNEVAIIGPNMQPQTFLYENNKLKPTTQNQTLQKSALAIIAVLNDLYEQKLYR